MFTITLYDATGRILYSTDAAKSVLTIDMSSNAAGLYLIKATRLSDQKVYLQKIVKP
ncbi:MAG: T9SS type A sorting domain-containing protein [Saprospiraceae bacterium]|nr:T9SS type A sorting domain-containing protein [Saprospiraceae bacterium]